MKTCSPSETDSAPIARLKKLVRERVDCRIKINKLMKMATCFDPAVRHAVLSNDECRQLLQDAFKYLSCESPIRHIFCSDPGVDLTSQPSNTNDEDEKEEISAKKLRMSLLQVSDLSHLFVNITSYTPRSMESYVLCVLHSECRRASGQKKNCFDPSMCKNSCYNIYIGNLSTSIVKSTT